MIGLRNARLSVREGAARAAEARSLRESASEGHADFISGYLTGKGAMSLDFDEVLEDVCDRALDAADYDASIDPMEAARRAVDDVVDGDDADESLRRHHRKGARGAKRESAARGGKPLAEGLKGKHGGLSEDYRDSEYYREIVSHFEFGDDDFFDAVAYVIDRVDGIKDLTDEGIYDELYATEFIYDEDEWAIMEHYQTPDKADLDGALDDFYDDCFDIVKSIRERLRAEDGDGKDESLSGESRKPAGRRLPEYYDGDTKIDFAEEARAWVDDHRDEVEDALSGAGLSSKPEDIVGALAKRAIDIAFENSNYDLDVDLFADALPYAVRDAKGGKAESRRIAPAAKAARQAPKAKADESAAPKAAPKSSPYEVSPEAGITAEDDDVSTFRGF